MVPRLPRLNQGDDLIRRYQLALRDPFHPDARGAKCMVYPTDNTSTLTLCISYAKFMTQDGSDRLIVFPNPNLIGWTPVNGSSIGVSSILGPATVNPQSLPYGITGAIWTSSDGTFLSTSTCGANALLANYRLVGGGVKFRSVLPTTQVQPRCTLMTLPCVHNALTWSNVTANNAFTSPTNQTAVGGLNELWLEQTMFGVSPSTVSNFLASPNTKDFTLYDILTDEAVTVFKPTSPAAFDFNDIVGYAGGSINPFVNRAGDTVAAGDVADYVVSGAPVLSVVGETGDVQCDGWTGAWLDVRAPGVVSGATYMVVDHIYHLEGIPKSSQVNGSGVQRYTGKGLSIEDALATSRRIADIVMPHIPTVVDQLSHVMTAMGLTTNATRNYRPMLRSIEL